MRPYRKGKEGRKEEKNPSRILKKEEQRPGAPTRPGKVKRCSITIIYMGGEL